MAVLVVAVRAHDPGISTAQVAIDGRKVEVTLGFAPADAAALLSPAERTGDLMSSTEFAEVRSKLLRIAPELWELRSDGRAVALAEAMVEWVAEDNVTFRLSWNQPAGDLLGFRAAAIPALPSGHRQFAIVTDGAGMLIAKKLLSAQDPGIEVNVAVGSAKGDSASVSVSAPTNWGFVRLGIEHIWTGYDHLLFLFGLLIVCRTFRSMVGIVSCFTVAHSITLGLAALDLVTMPSRWAEMAIAASVVYVGVENLVRRGEAPRGRWLLTFLFGLVHGFGFAGVLRSLGVGKGGTGIAWPLFTFNLGVEIGQVVVASAVLPGVFWLRRKKWFLDRGVRVLSAGVALAGLYWLVVRIGSG